MTRPSTATTRSTRRCARRCSSTVASRSRSSGPTVASTSITSCRGSPPVPSTSPALVIDLDPAPQAHEPRGDRRRRFDRDLERRGVVRARLHVEHHRGARPPAGFVLADHQLAGAGGRAPVHAAQVVADLVLAQRDELVAEVAHDRARRARLVLGADAAPDRDRRHDVVHAWAHDELGLARAGLAAAGQAERIGDRDRERPDAVAAAATGGDAVRGAGGGAGRERRDEEARRAPAFVEPVGGGEQGSGAGAEVLDQQVDAALGADVQAVGVHAPAHRQRGRGLEPQPRGGRDHQHQRGEPEHQHLDGAEQVAADDEPERGAGERPAPPGEGGGAARFAGRSADSTDSRWAATAASAVGAAGVTDGAQPPVAPGTGTEARIAAHDVVGGDAAQLGVGGDEQAGARAPTGATRFTSSGIT